jgi:LacI family transcriptional regulator
MTSARTHRKHTMVDVAKHAGVNVAVVSKVLSGDTKLNVRPETRERVLQAVRELDYRPNALARGLVQGQTGNIAVAVLSSHTPVFTNPFYSEVLGGIEGHLEALNLHLLMTSLKRGQDLVRLAAERRADGLIVIGSELEEHYLREITGLTPLVLVDRELEGLTCVATDNRAGMGRATLHLLERGCRQLAFVSDSPNNPNFIARLQGFHDALGRFGIEPESAPIGASPDGGYSATLELLSKHQFDGLVCANDIIAHTTMRALRESGIGIPRQVAVVGFDGTHDWTSNGVPLSTMWVDKRRLGLEGVKLLLERIAQPDLEPKTVIVSTELRVGGSS